MALILPQTLLKIPHPTHHRFGLKPKCVSEHRPYSRRPARGLRISRDL